MEIKIKQKLIIEKSNFQEDGNYILFLHNSTKRGDCWRRIFKGSRKECLLVRNRLLNGETL